MNNNLKVAFLLNAGKLVKGDNLEIASSGSDIYVVANGVKVFAIDDAEWQAKIVEDVALASDISAAIDLKKEKVTVNIVDVITVQNDIGRDVDVAIGQLQIVQKQASTTQNTPSETIEIGFRGGVNAFPKRAVIFDQINNGIALTEEFEVYKKDTTLRLTYGGEDVGAQNIDNLDPAYQRKILSFNDDEKIPAKYVKKEGGVLKVNVELKDFTVDVSGAFNEEEAYALSVGVTKEEFQRYIDIMMHYNLPTKLIKKIIATWEPLMDEYLDRYIPLEKIAHVDSKGACHPLYIDKRDDVKAIATYTLEGRKNLLLIGEASAGKNTLIELIAGIYRRPLLRESLSGGSDLSTLFGDRTVVNNTVEFDRAQLIKAAEDGCFIVLDEINTLVEHFQTALHSILEPDTRAVNVGFYKYVKARPMFRVFGTMNPSDSDDYVVRRLNAAFSSRFTPIKIESVNFEEVLKNACPDANAEEVKQVSKIFESLRRIANGQPGSLSAAFLALRVYMNIVGSEFEASILPLKRRCMDNLAYACPDDRTQTEVVIKQINDLLG